MTAHNPGLGNLCDCGACMGLTSLTPVKINNRQGLSAVAYRSGVHSLFKRSMLAGLSDTDRPLLLGLKTREDDDFTIALLDAWATVSDVLTFYQERIANESFLGTATERVSLLEMARLIGYELRPGVAAGTYVAFTMEASPGSPPQATIDAGVKIQSIPAQNEQPQTFETSAAIQARVEWNALTPRLIEPQPMTRGLRSLYLQGTATQLQVGDGVLIVGHEREGFSASERWDFRILNRVETESEKDRTLIAWDEGLGHDSPAVDPSTDGARIYAMRQRAAIFGHNAPDPLLLNLPAGSNLVDSTGEWKGYDPDLSTGIELDAVYAKVLPGSWAVLVSPRYDGELCRVQSVETISLRQFGLSAKVTRIIPDVVENESFFKRRETTVFVQSEQQEFAGLPITAPVFGTSIALGQLAPDLAQGQAIAVTGKAQRLRLAPRANNLSLESADGSLSVPLHPDDLLEVVSPPVVTASKHSLTPDELLAALASTTPESITWQVRSDDGFVGFLEAASDRVLLAPAGKDALKISEVAFIDAAKDAVRLDNGATTVLLSTPLLNCYDRETVTINANVAPATHGETVQEVMGAGDSAQTYQRFALKQSPLTYVSAANASGAASTLQVRVNGLLWQETPSLYGRGKQERLYITQTDDDGKTTVLFGDGVSGARLPTGQDNVRAVYRKGIGLGGLLKAGQLSNLMSRPLGVKEATNPEPSSGAADRESLSDARTNAPLTVLTLDRTVSLQDYEDFARAFAGIGKALATWSWDGVTRRVFLTVAGPNGASVEPDGQTFTNLTTSLRDSGDPFVSFSMRSFSDVRFKLEARIKVDEPTFLRKDVTAAVEAALRDRFSFEQRAFGQPVSISEVIAVMQGVPGVIAVDVDRLYRADQAKKLNNRLASFLPQIGPDGTMQPAELLTLDAAPLEFGVML